MMSAPMDPDCLAPDQVPETSRLYSIYLSNPSQLGAFYAHPPDLRGVREAARELKGAPERYPAEMRFGVAQILREQNARFGGDSLEPKVKRNLDRLESGAVAIVTGQQCGLFLGPAYTFYKALSALRISERLTRSGIEAVPIFWMASEDHDLAEANHIYWPAPANSAAALNGEAIAKLELPASPEDEGRSVGSVLLGKGIEMLVRRAADSLSGAFAPEFARAMTAAYRPEETYGSAFARLMSKLFAARGLILLDPQDARLHQLAAPILQRAAQQQEALTAALLAQNKKIEKAGYHAQVRVTETSTLLFRIEGGLGAEARKEDGRSVGANNIAGYTPGKRIALKRINSGFAAGSEHFSAQELTAAIAAAPELFSPNALLRPVVQDSLLPTVAYIGGPAEIAYFAQNRVLYDKLLGRMPAILPRASFTLIEPEIARILKRYDLNPADVLAGKQSLAAEMERRHIPRGLAAKFSAEQKKLERMLADLRKSLTKLDPTLAGALDTAARKILFQLEKLRRQAGRASDFRSGILAKHEAAILSSLHPQHTLQERLLSLIPFLARHGDDLIETLSKHCGLPTGKIRGAKKCAHRFIHL
jgi:bacillithiol biosynthesis cysteine-adding enzyme BshC